MARDFQINELKSTMLRPCLNTLLWRDAFAAFDCYNQ
jgi:hypothetical protein